jgi:hypothetical protein
MLPFGERRSPVAGPRHKGTVPHHGEARYLDPPKLIAFWEGMPSDLSTAALAKVEARLERRREQAERATQANNYWSATTNAGNPNNAQDVNFNNGNVNNDNKTNNNYVRAVRSRS